MLKIQFKYFSYIGNISCVKFKILWLKIESYIIEQVILLNHWNLKILLKYINSQMMISNDHIFI